MVVDNASPSETLSGENGSVTPEVTKAEVDAIFKTLRSLQKELKDMKAVKVEPIHKEESSSDKPNSENAELQKQVKLLLEREAQKDAEMAAHRLQTSLQEALVQNGFDSKLMKHATAFLNSEKMVRYDEDGNMKMKLNQIDYDLSDAVKLWSKTEDAKLYIAPKNALGSGQQGSFKAGSIPVAKNDKMNEFNELLAKLPGAMSSL